MLTRSDTHLVFSIGAQVSEHIKVSMGVVDIILYERFPWPHKQGSICQSVCLQEVNLQNYGVGDKYRKLWTCPWAIEQYQNDKYCVPLMKFYYWS